MYLPNECKDLWEKYSSRSDLDQGALLNDTGILHCGLMPGKVEFANLDTEIHALT